MKQSITIKKYLINNLTVIFFISLIFLIFPFGWIIVLSIPVIIIYLKISIDNEVLKEAGVDRGIVKRVKKMIRCKTPDDIITKELSSSCREDKIKQILHYYRGNELTLFTRVLLVCIVIYNFLALIGSSGARKPVIYLYPKTKKNVNVKLYFQGKFIADYPTYDTERGWDVIAHPNGKLINKLDKKEYQYLFWEGKFNNKIQWDLSTGFIVEGKDVKDFLQEKLSLIGLTPKEYNEFIVYWYPLMKDNKYNLIHFAENQYTDAAILKITPQPNSILRVFMVYKALKKKVNIKEQKITPFKRKGFTVVEWGGLEL